MGGNFVGFWVYLTEVGDKMKFDVAAFFDGVVELEEGREFGEELLVFSFEIRFVKKFNGDGNDVEGLFAGFGLDFGEVGGDLRKVARGGGDESFGFGEEFFSSGGGFSVDVRGIAQGVCDAGEENLGAREDGREEGAGGFGEEDEVTKVFRLFESFEEGVLSSFVHNVGGGDHEKAVAGLAAIGEGDKLTDLFDGDETGGFGFVGGEEEGVFESMGV